MHTLQLTDTELSVLECAANGLSRTETAERLAYTDGHIGWYRQRVMSKLGAISWENAIAIAVGTGVIRIVGYEYRVSPGSADPAGDTDYARCGPGVREHQRASGPAQSLLLVGEVPPSGDSAENARPLIRASGSTGMALRNN